MCKKPLKHLRFEKWDHFENDQNWPPRKRYSLCKMVSLSQKLKMPKRCEKRFYHHIRVVVCKKPHHKKPSISKMRAFWKWPKLGHHAKAIACLGQKLKMPKRCKNDSTTTLELFCAKKQPLQKAPNIRKMRAFWIWPKLATTQKPLQNSQFGSKFKNAKKVRKTIIPPH